MGVSRRDHCYAESVKGGGSGGGQAKLGISVGSGIRVTFGRQQSCLGRAMGLVAPRGGRRLPGWGKVADLADWSIFQGCCCDVRCPSCLPSSAILLPPRPHIMTAKLSSRKVSLLDDGDAQGDMGFKINTKFAERYQERKKKEELSILEDRYKERLAKKGISKAKATAGGERNNGGDLTSSSATDSESDVIEDEDGDLITPAVEAQILKTMAEIRAQNPKVYDPSTSFFSREQLKQAEQEWKQAAASQKREEKPLRLKDFYRQQLLSGEALKSESEEEESAKPPIKTHQEEQAEVLNEFLQAAKDTGGDADDGLLKMRRKTEEEITREDVEYRAFLLENLASNEHARESMSAWFDGRERSGAPITGDEQFLIEYVLNRGWVDKERKALPSYGQIVGEDDDDIDADAEAVEQMEEFEERYNFRHEQPGGDQIATYPRQIEGSLRRPDNRRREQRAARQSRKKEEKEKQREELKRLKNLKKAEIQEKLRRIQAISGSGRVAEAGLDLESDFDPETHDQKMQTLFGDDYYREGNQDGDGKPVWSESEGEEEGTPAVLSQASETVKKVLKKVQKKSKAAESDDKKKVSKLVGKYLDEYYQLDYEDMIGDLPCHFKYQTVPATTFGLKPMDILVADEKSLNAHVSLKRLAPYRAAEQLKADEATFASKKRLYKFYDLLDRRLAAAQQEAAEGDYRGTTKQSRGAKHRK